MFKCGKSRARCVGFLAFISLILPSPVVVADSLPFTMATAVRDKVSLMPPHVSDSPVRPVTIDGDVWVMYVPDPYHNPTKIVRFRGTNLEHMVQQPDGRVDFPDSPLPGGWQASSFMNSGMWYDADASTLYALIHTEYEHDGVGTMAGWCRKKVRLAASKDLGLTWTLVGDVLTSCYTRLDEWTKFSGSEFEVGPADFDLYVDERGGYFYVTGWNGWTRKKGPMDVTLLYCDVARCAIRDKMAPGRWHKFNSGTWTEPGLGGKGSRVPMDCNGIYGSTIYNTYLKKYMRFGVIMGAGDRGLTSRCLTDGSPVVTTCTDLAKQDWSPAVKLLDEPANRTYGFTPAAADKKNGVACGRTFHVYNYWSGQADRVIDVTLGEGTTPLIPMPAGQSYSYEPHPEAGDLVESRRTKIVGSAGTEMVYAGDAWTVESDPEYFQGQVRKCGTSGNSVSFTFKGTDIYWRAVGAIDGGKADVYLDNALQATVDCYFRDSGRALEKMFALVKRGLDPNVLHTIKIVIRGDANSSSKGNWIRHVGFEYSAESYRAQAGFSSVQGKNHWHFQSWDGKRYADLPTYDIRGCRWRGDKCALGLDWQRPEEGASSPVRRWTAPHSGIVCVDGLLGTDAVKVIWDPVVTYVDAMGDHIVPVASEGKFRVNMKKNAEQLMTLDMPANSTPTTYRLHVKVNAGDSLYFTASVTPSAQAR